MLGKGSAGRSSATKGPNTGKLFSRTCHHFRVLESHSTQDEEYWRKKIYGKILRTETIEVNGVKKKINIRKWTAPSEWMDAIVNRAVYDSHKNRQMGRFQKAMCKNMTARFLYTLQECAYKGNKDIVVDGPKESRKSTLIMKIFLEERKAFERLGKKLAGPFLVWSIAQAVAAYQMAPDCSFVDMDEEHGISGKGKNTTILNWGSILESIRIRQISTAIASPEQKNMPGCETKLTPIGVWTKGLDRMRATNDQDPSECKIKVLVSAREHSQLGDAYKPIGHLILEVADAIKFMAEIDYEARKRADVEALTKKFLGSSRAWTEEDRIAAHAAEERLVEELHKRNWDGKAKTRIKTVIFDAGIDFPSHLEDFVIDFVWARKKEFEPKEPEEPEVDEGAGVPTSFDRPFRISPEDEEKILTYIQEQSDTPEMPRNVEMYRKDREGVKRIELEKEYKIDHSNVSRGIKSAEGAISDIVGHRYEEYLEPILRLDKHYANVDHDGKPKRPDFICTGTENGVLFTEFVSAKYLAFRGKKSIAISIKKVSQELEDARKEIVAGRDGRCVLIVRDRDSNHSYKYQCSKNEILTWQKIRKDTVKGKVKKTITVSEKHLDDAFA